MKKQNKKVLFIARTAMIAALYGAATSVCAAFGIAFGPIQLRLSEVLTAFAVITPASIPGLTIGCVIGNLSSQFGIWDIIFGSLATFFAALTGYLLKSVRFGKLPVLSMLMPVIFNALIIGAEIAVLTPGGKAWYVMWIYYAATVGLSELIVCMLGGLPVARAFENNKRLKNLLR